MADHLDDLTLAELTERAERLGYPAWLATPSGRKMAIWHGDEAAALRWLLRQPEAVARAACYARGVAEERARVVAWAESATRTANDEADRSLADDGPNYVVTRVQRQHAVAYGMVARAIGRGEHEAGR